MNMPTCKLVHKNLNVHEWKKFGGIFDILYHIDEKGMLKTKCWCGCNKNFTRQFEIEIIDYKDIKEDVTRTVLSIDKRKLTQENLQKDIKTQNSQIGQNGRMWHGFKHNYVNNTGSTNSPTMSSKFKRFN